MSVSTNQDQLVIQSDNDNDNGGPLANALSLHIKEYYQNAGKVQEVRSESASEGTQ